jgi:hypothetical protein
LSASAVTTAVVRPKQRFSPRATLYSPPPSHTGTARRVDAPVAGIEPQHHLARVGSDAGRPATALLDCRGGRFDLLNAARSRDHVGARLGHSISDGATDA